MLTESQGLKIEIRTETFPDWFKYKMKNKVEYYFNNILISIWIKNKLCILLKTRFCLGNK